MCSPSALMRAAAAIAAAVVLGLNVVLIVRILA
jgi:hypothetical protein